MIRAVKIRTAINPGVASLYTEEMRVLGWSSLATIYKRPGQMVVRVPLPYQVRAAPPRIWMEGPVMVVEWNWWQPNPLVESERPAKMTDLISNGAGTGEGNEDWPSASQHHSQHLR